MPIEEPTLGQTLWLLLTNLGTLAQLLAGYAFHWVFLIGWVAWWLLAVDWRRCWAVLGEGAWAALVLVVLLAALVWSRLVPATEGPNFWWQLGYLSGLVALAFVCGWLQGVFGWAPREISLEPPVSHGHDGHHHGHHGHVAQVTEPTHTD